MFIKSIVLDGFKSYGTRTEILGFDKEFNAITGLNGSGKSNILDSICFVLGISQLNHVRVNSLQDLVFKSGQSGVTKATVTITFDNNDKKNCPIGFEKYSEITVSRQVVIGGKNKYLINGTSVVNKRVQDLFCSVGLNVNNPHFLIMQGRIVKVLNMKPLEILSMIEEAAGTKMYEVKKQTTQKNIEKKDSKLKEINNLANEDIIPKINKLRQERQMYLEFQTVERQLENLNSMFFAYQYISSKKIMQQSNEELEIKTQEMRQHLNKIEQNKAKLAEIDAEVTEHQKNNSYYETLKLEISELQQAIENGQEQIKTCETNITKFEQDLGEISAQVIEAKEIVTQVQANLKEERQKISAKNKEIQKKINEKTNVEGQIAEIELEIKKLSHSVKQLEEKCKQFKLKEQELQKKINKCDSRLVDAENMSEKEANDLKLRIVSTQKRRDDLSRHVNVKAQRMFEQEEKQYAMLMKKKNAVENDKKKLIKLIADIDKKKLMFLSTAADQISKDFGSIFSTLLPGTDAKLKKINEKNLLEGIEIQIAIGGIWKENLSELSGGQKSLVALSLILSMLLFKPAPIYILDEVDAALDLSHTQNIGKMLKKHFKQSQFIIVSLKDGMFNNANVIFRTEFAKDISKVTRNVNLHASQ